MNIFEVSRNEFNDRHPELKGRALTLTAEDKPYVDEYVEIIKSNQKRAARKNKKAEKKLAKCEHGNGKKNSECDAKYLELIKTDQGKKGYTLKVPGPNIIFKKNQYVNCDVYEIVAGPKQKPADITIKANGLKGPCTKTHKDGTFNFEEEELSILSQTDSQLKIKAYSVEFRQGSTLDSLLAILKYIFIKQSIDHKIAFSTCGFEQEVLVRVYPALAAKASVSLNWEWGYSKKGKSLEKDADSNSSLGDKLEYSFSVKHKEIDLVKIDSKKKEDKPSFMDFLNSFSENMDYLNQKLSVFLSDSQTLKVNIKPTLSGSCALEEVDDKPFVDMMYHINIGFNPLVQIDAKADVSGDLLLSIPVIGPFLAAAVAAAKSAKMADVFLGFTINGSVNVNADITRQAGVDDVDSALKIDGNIKIDLLGKVAADIHVWKFHYAVGAKLGAESGVKMDESKLSNDENGVYFPLKLTFLGIVVYYQTWKNKGVDIFSSSVPRSVSKAQSMADNTQEIEDVENLPDTNKMNIVDPYVLYDDKLYVIGGTKSSKV